MRASLNAAPTAMAQGAPQVAADDAALPGTTPYWALRIGAAACFIGHGAFGLITKAAWLPYFAVVGIPERWAWKLMPLVGSIDVLAGMAVLFAPTRLPLAYMAVWALWTALLRPLAGESVFEAVERAGNYGVPLAMLLWVGLPTSLRSLLKETSVRAQSAASTSVLRRVLAWTTGLLLAGHGALVLSGKPLLATHYALLGLPVSATAMVGWFEIALAIAIFVRPTVTLLVFAVVWKLATESLFLAAGAPVWEFVERAGSYAAPAALAAMLILERRRRRDVGRG